MSVIKILKISNSHFPLTSKASQNGNKGVNIWPRQPSTPEQLQDRQVHRLPHVPRTSLPSETAQSSPPETEDPPSATGTLPLIPLSSPSLLHLQLLLPLNSSLSIWKKQEESLADSHSHHRKLLLLSGKPMPHNFKRVQRPENSTRSHKSVLTRTEGNSISTDCALQRAREENETKKQPIQLREKEKQTESDSTAEDQATEQAKTDPTRPRKQEKKSHGIECQDRKSQERQPSGVFLSGLCALQTLDYVSGSYWAIAIMSGSDWS